LAVAFTEHDIGLLTVDEAADVAGVRPGTIRSWISRHDLPTVRNWSGRVLISELAVLDCEMARRQATRGRRRAC